MGLKDKERSGVCEIIRGKLYFAVLHRPEDLKASWLPGPAICFSIDNELVYEPFYADFGPLNLACTYHFCWKLQGLLQEGEMHGHCVCFCCSSDPKKKPNGAVLIGAYLVLFEGLDAEAAYAPLAEFESFLPFRDPTCGISTYHLSVLDCIRAVAKGKKIGWIDFNNFNVEEYEYFEQVENGDLNWIVPNKIVAFSGPGARRTEVCGYRTLVPEDYVEYFNRSGVTTIIRLNKRMYDKRRFTEHGLSHHDLYFPDGSCPPERIVQRFLEIVEDTPRAIAVHCKAGLGRTGVLIGCYLMKHFRFTANEAIGYLRIVRPGSVIGPQQHFLRDMQSRMWKAGDALRRQKSDHNRNSRHHRLPTVLDSQPVTAEPVSSALMSPLSAVSTTVTHGWNQGKGSLVATRSYSTNPVIRRVSTREIDSVHKSRRDLSPNVNSNLFHTSKDRPVYHKEDEVSSAYKSGVLHTHSNVSQCTRPYFRNFKDASGRGSILTATESMASCSNQCKKMPFYNESTYMPRTYSSFVSRNSDYPGILRNVNVDSKLQADEGACIQRILNAAGQPRKVVVPASQAGPRDCSLGRRRSSSPARNTVN